jgi:S-adenosylmethionine hydrolase
VEVLARNYAETGPGELFTIIGSSGYYEISVREASAARATGCAGGSPVELTLW